MGPTYGRWRLRNVGSKPTTGTRKECENGTGVKRVRNKTSVIRGVVIPMDWDEHGNVVRIAISSHDENEYLVDKGGKGNELLAFIRKEVEVDGEVKEEDHRKVIKVKKYHVKREQDSEPGS
jgi:hypothetical protein